MVAKQHLQEPAMTFSSATPPSRKVSNLSVQHSFLHYCNVSKNATAGYYWIDPNIGGKQDAIQVFCSKPGCSCIDYALKDSSAPTYWADAGEKPFSELSEGYEVRNRHHSHQITELIRQPFFPSSHGQYLLNRQLCYSC